MLPKSCPRDYQSTELAISLLGHQYRVLFDSSQSFSAWHRDDPTDFIYKHAQIFCPYFFEMLEFLVENTGPWSFTLLDSGL